MWLCCPSPGPGAAGGARPGCCEGSGRYGIGRPPRPGRLRWRGSASDSFWASPLRGKSVAEALWQSSLLRVSLTCGPRRREEGSVSGVYLRGHCLGRLLGAHLYLLSGAILVWGSFREACVRDAFDEISAWGLFGEGVSLSEPPHPALSVQGQHRFSPFRSPFPLDSFTLFLVV